MQEEKNIIFFQSYSVIKKKLMESSIIKKNIYI